MNVSGIRVGLLSLVVVVAPSSLVGATITGDPSVDAGWSFGGNSLANGTYVRGEATFSYDIYSTAFTVAEGSTLEIADGDFSWNAGDTILGLGGKFVNTTAAAGGWTGDFDWSPYNGGDGVAVNDDVSGSSRPVAKFGTSTSTFSTSTIKPLFGNGVGDDTTGNGGDGAIMTRITSNRSSSGAGALGLLDKVYRYDEDGAVLLSASMDADILKVSRLIYTWDTTFASGHIGSWEIFLNISLLEREFPYAAYPAIGNDGILAVQRSDNRFTDGLVAVPEPASLMLLAFGAGAALLPRSRKG